MICVEYYTLHVLRLISAQFNSGYDEVLYALDSNFQDKLNLVNYIFQKYSSPTPMRLNGGPTNALIVIVWANIGSMSVLLSRGLCL